MDQINLRARRVTSCKNGKPTSGKNRKLIGGKNCELTGGKNRKLTDGKIVQRAPASRGGRLGRWDRHINTGTGEFSVVFGSSVLERSEFGSAEFGSSKYDNLSSAFGSSELGSSGVMVPSFGSWIPGFRSLRRK